MRMKKLFLRMVSAALVGWMLFCHQPWTRVAAEEVLNQELAAQYISDVKMFYGVDEAQAKRLCESEGYIFCPQDLKEGADSLIHAYMGYKKTEDQDEAITDLSLLDMRSSAFTEMSYGECRDHLGLLRHQPCDLPGRCGADQSGENAGEYGQAELV